MMTLYRTALSLCCALTVAASLLLTGPPATAAVAERDSQSSAQRSAKWKCKSFETRSTVGKRCVRFTDVDRDWTLVYGAGVNNRTRKTVPLHCKSNTSETMNYSFSTEVSGEAGFVFGKLSATVSAGIQKTVTAGYETSVDVDVAPGQRLACDWGIYSYKARGIYRVTMCNASGCRVSKEPFRVRAPERNFWKLHVIR